MKIQNRQSLLDIAVQVSGTIETVYDIATENNMSVTEIDLPSSVMVSDLATERKTLEYYNKRAITPATGAFLAEGIGYQSISILIY